MRFDEPLGDQAFLQAVRAKIASRSNWTTRKFSRDKHSRWVPPDNTRACRWCLIGAVRAIEAGSSLRIRDERSDHLASLLGFSDWGALANWQDKQKHAAVIEALDERIRRFQQPTD